MLYAANQQLAPSSSAPRGTGAPSEPIADVIRDVIRDLDAEIAEPSALGVDMTIARHLRARLAGALVSAA